MSKIEDTFQAVRLNDWDEYLKLIDTNTINQKNEFGQSLLHEAIAYQASRIAKHLIELGIDINSQDSNGQTPLHFAVTYGDTTIVDALIEAKVDANLRDKYGNNPLWTAVFNARGKYELVELLQKQGCDFLTKNKAGRSPRDFAAQIGDQNLLKILI